VKAESGATPMSIDQPAAEESNPVPSAVETIATPSSQQTESSVLLPLEEFAEDLDLRLGRANGNVYQRKNGVEGVHDGQIMVRLKKKRFIVIDYGVVPTDNDVRSAALNPHVSTPDGAGKQKCITPECTKIGVPVLLYDSEPSEPASLYMRSGLCFTCQRVLNEKRRTQRKRKSDVVDPAQASQVSQGAYAMGPKKFKMNGEIMELSPDAIIINGPVDGAKMHGEGYGFAEIGTDLQSCMRVATTDTDRLLEAVSNSASNESNPSSAVAFAAAAATAAAAVAAAAAVGGESEVVGDVSEEAVSAANAAAVDALENRDGSTTNTAAASQATPEDIAALYDKAFLSLSKTIFLLGQWKESWDSAVAAAVAQETVNDPSLADVVASAAAVAASTNANTSESQGESTTTNMMPLLLAAEQKGDNESVAGTLKKEETNEGVQQNPPTEPAAPESSSQNPPQVTPGGSDVQVFGV